MCGSWCWQGALSQLSVPSWPFIWKAWEGEELTPALIGLLQNPKAGHRLWRVWPAWLTVFLHSPGLLYAFLGACMGFGKPFPCLGHGVRQHVLAW